MKCNRGPRPHSRALSLHGVYIYTGQILPLPPPSPCSPSHPHTHTSREKMPHKTATTQSRTRPEQKKCCRFFFLSTIQLETTNWDCLCMLHLFITDQVFLFFSLCPTQLDKGSFPISRKKMLKHPEFSEKQTATSNPSLPSFLFCALGLNHQGPPQYLLISVLIRTLFGIVE